MSSSRANSRRIQVAVFLVVLVIAAALRLYRLSELPVGLHYDEAANGILAGEIAEGIRTPIFIRAYTGKEVLFFYWTALWMKLLGFTPAALRLGAALLGIATVAATVWAVYELLCEQDEGLWLGIMAAAFLATSFWHLILSRYAFRAVAQPLFQALTVAALWRGLRMDRAGWLVAAGLFCGLTAYTYLAARAFPIPLGAALGVLLVAARDERRTRLFQLATFVGVASLTVAPLVYYWLTHPGSFVVRVQQVAADSWADVWTGLVACLKMFFLRGDPYIRFNLPHRPLFLPGAAAVAVLGFGLGLWRLVRRWRDAASSSLYLASYAFLLVGMPVMLLPSALASDEITPSNLRTVGLLPFIYVFPALGLLAVTSALRRVLGRFGSGGGALFADRALRAVLTVLVLALCAPKTAVAYFGEWAPSPALYREADGDLVRVADYLNKADLDSTVPYVASEHYRHPTLAFLADDYDEIRWLVGGQTLVFPEEGEALLIFPRSAAMELDWVRAMVPARSLVAAPQGPDGSPSFHAFRVDGADRPTPPQPRSAEFGHVVRFLGYAVASEPRSGGEVDLTLWWEVLDAADHPDYRSVARLADPWGFVWGESQPFHYPSEQWTRGEVVVDTFSIGVAPGAPPGDYRVRFGFYSPGGDVRISVLDDGGAYAGTFAEVPIHLGRAATTPSLEDLGIENSLNIDMGGLRLLGSSSGARRVRPGERLYLALHWRADEMDLPAQSVSIQLGDTQLYGDHPVHGTYPFDEWSLGEVVRDRYDLRIPLDTPPGEHPLRLDVGDVTVGLGNVTVRETNRVFEIPEMSHQVGVELGERVELLGYDLSSDSVSPGETLVLTLHWRALAEMTRDYTVFTHLLAPDGSMTGQQDHEPVDGSYSTSLWVPGEIVTDVYEIPVRSDASPGEHRLEIGMYISETGTRLPATGSADDAVSLEMVTVVE